MPKIFFKRSDIHQHDEVEEVTRFVVYKRIGKEARWLCWATWRRRFWCLDPLYAHWENVDWVS